MSVAVRSGRALFSDSGHHELQHSLTRLRRFPSQHPHDLANIHPVVILLRINIGEGLGEEGGRVDVDKANICFGFCYRSIFSINW